jgi:hypothetical protein
MTLLPPHAASSLRACISSPVFLWQMTLKIPRIVQDARHLDGAVGTAAV